MPGGGVSVEAKVRCGAVTTLGVTQTGDGRLKFNISEGEAIDAPTHQLALSVGHNAGLCSKIAELMNIPYAIY